MPLIGICLGMQLLLDESEEVEQGAQPEPGLSLLAGRVVRLRGATFTSRTWAGTSFCRCATRRCCATLNRARMPILSTLTSASLPMQM